MCLTGRCSRCQHQEIDTRRAKAKHRHELGREFAAHENGALAGMAHSPLIPKGCANDPDFKRGYHEWTEEHTPPW